LLLHNSVNLGQAEVAFAKLIQNSSLVQPTSAYCELCHVSDLEVRNDFLLQNLQEYAIFPFNFLGLLLKASNDELLACFLQFGFKVRVLD